MTIAMLMSNTVKAARQSLIEITKHE